MADKVQLIKEEIGRLYSEAGRKSYNGEVEGEMCAYDKIISFIDSLPEEHNEDLEEEIKCYIKKEFPDGIGFPNVPKIAHHFAEWQKQQMVKDAVEGEVRKGYVGNQIVVSSKDGSAKYVAFDASYADAFCVGDKVKIIIIKENIL